MQISSGAHLETTTVGPRTVPVRSSRAGGKAQECSRPPRPSDVLRAGIAAGTARAPVGMSRWCAPMGVETRKHLDMARIKLHFDRSPARRIAGEL